MKLSRTIESIRINGPETRLQPRPALTTTRKDRDMAKPSDIDISLLRQLLKYEPETGDLFWLYRPEDLFQTLRAYRAWNSAHAGKRAIYTPSNHGHLHGTLLYRTVKAHRVAWAIYHGEWPKGSIDHINGDPADNRISNLRDVPQQVNMRNTKRRSTNTSGVTGVSWFKRHQLWQVRVGRRHIGYFSSLDEAKCARAQASDKLGFHPNHGRSRP